MKIIILILSLFLFSCTKEDSCDEQLSKINKEYISAMQNAGYSLSALTEITRQYEIRKQSVLNNCK